MTASVGAEALLVGPPPLFLMGGPPFGTSSTA